MNRRTLEKIREEELMLEPDQEEGDDEDTIARRVEEGELDALFAGFWDGHRKAA